MNKTARYRFALATGALLLVSGMVTESQARRRYSDGYRPRYEYVPSSTSPFLFGFGGNIGLNGGLPEPGLNAKVFGGDTNVYLELGFGLLPDASQVELHNAAVFAFRKKTDRFRPKVTMKFTTVATGWVLREVDFFFDNELQRKYYPGWGMLGGMDFRMATLFPLCFDVNLGVVVPFDGYGSVKDDYRLARDNAIGRGHSISESEPDLFPLVFSVGLNYEFGRGKKRRPVPDP